MNVFIPPEVNGMPDGDSVTPRNETSSNTPSNAKVFIPESVSGVVTQDTGQLEARPGYGSSGLGFIYDAFTGEDRETKETRELPEVLSMVKDLSAKQELQIMAGLLTENNPTQQMEIIKKAAPETIFRKDEKDNIIVDFKGGKSGILNKPGMTSQDAAQMATDIVAFFPAGRLAALASSLVTKMGSGLALASATELSKQAVTGELGVIDPYDASEVLVAGALQFVGEGAQQGFRSLKNARQAINTGSEVGQVAKTQSNVATAEEAQKAIRELGVDVPLFKGQKTVNPKTLEEMQTVTQLEGGATKAMNLLDEQNIQAEKAVDLVLNIISDGAEDALVIAPDIFRAAARDAVETPKRLRSKEAGPLYSQARRRQRQGKAPPINTKTLGAKVSNMLNQEGSNSDAGIMLSRVLERIKSSEGKINKLQAVKKDLDGKIDPSNMGTDNNIKRILGVVQRDLVETMDKGSPSLRAGKQVFQEMSPAVEEVEKSILGVIAKTKDVNLKGISKAMFNPAETNIKTIKIAKAKINAADPGAWNVLLRSEVERRMGSIKLNMDDMTNQNVPLMLKNAIFGNNRNTEILYAGAEGEALKNLKYLNVVLTRAAKGRMPGSPTATRKEILDELRTKGVGGKIIDILTSPLETAGAVVTGQSTKQRQINNVSKLTDLVFDSKFTADMKELRNLNPNTSAALKTFLQLLNTPDAGI